MKKSWANKITSPSSLQTTQEWFASIMTRPMHEDDEEESANSSFIAEETARYVTSSNLSSQKRMQIYNQQYWWRLLNSLHENFPLVTRLFGHQAFNEEIGIPYLLKYPPNHWSLNLLGERLPKWISEDYHAPDQSLVQHAANLDWAFTASFVAPQLTPLDLNSLMASQPENLLNYTFYLQPHVHLFQWDYDLLSFRIDFLKQDVDFWTKNDFPLLPKGKTYYFVLFRTLKNTISWRTISKGAYALLHILKNGATLEMACEFLEKQETAIYEEAIEQLQAWLQEWTHRNWLTLQKEENISSQEFEMY